MHPSYGRIAGVAVDPAGRGSGLPVLQISILEVDAIRTSGLVTAGTVGGRTVAIGVPLRGPCRGRVGILRPRYPSNDRPVHRSLRWGAGPDPEPVQRRHGHDERLQGRVTSDGSGWAFSSEGSAIADDAPVLAQPLVPINSAKAFVPASIELSQDYPDWMSEISKVLTRGYVDLMAQKTAVGAGTTEPAGLFTAMANTTTNPAHVSVTTVGKIGAVDVRKAWAALPERFRPAATWTMHENVLNQVRNDAGAASQVDLVVNREGTMIMGRPVITSSYFPDFTGTTGSESFLTVGDLSGYTVASRLGVTVELIPQMRNTSGIPIGERGYLACARVGGNVTVPTSQVLVSNT